MITIARSTTVRWALVAGLAGGTAWFVSMMLLFGPAQAILSNPEFQSAKFLYIAGQLEPLPRIAEAPWLLPLGLLLIGMIYGIVYRFVRPALTGSWWEKGIKFGLVAWVLMVPWFEFYLPWNMMHEPALLVLLEMVLWMGVLAAASLAMAGVYEWRVSSMSTLEPGESAP